MDLLPQGPTSMLTYEVARSLNTAITILHSESNATFFYLIVQYCCQSHGARVGRKRALEELSGERGSGGSAGTSKRGRAETPGKRIFECTTCFSHLIPPLGSLEPFLPETDLTSGQMHRLAGDVHGAVSDRVTQATR